MLHQLDYTNKFQFTVKEGVTFKNATLVHPLMQIEVQSLIDQLSEDLTVNKVIVFGSSVTLHCNSFSDLDVLVQRTDYNVKLNPYPICDVALDLLFQNDLGESILKEIQETGVLVFDREEYKNV